MNCISRFVNYLMAPRDAQSEEPTEESSLAPPPGSLAWYGELWDRIELRSTTRHAERIEWHVSKLLGNKSRYLSVEVKTGVPWFVVGCLHGLEASFNFKTYLHNGDPLGKKTTHVPKWVGPFFSWEVAAADALKREGFLEKKNWSIEHILQRCERYNGTGYLRFHSNVLSPYLWAGSHHYTKGKYVRDGKFSQTAISAQVGVATAIKKLEALEYIQTIRT